MKSTFWMTAQETEDELKRLEASAPKPLTEEERDAFIDGFNRGYIKGYEKGIQDEKKFQKAWA